MKKSISFLAAIGLLCSFIATETVWTPDKMHSQLNFSARHFGISQVDGRFESFNITMKSERADFTDAQVELKAETKSINTEVEYRDKDLRGANWFDAETYPSLDFKSTSMTKVKGNRYKLSGNLTLHGVTKKVDFDATLNGWAMTMTKKMTAGFTLKGKIRRSDYNLGGTALLTGVGDEINIWSNVELGKN